MIKQLSRNKKAMELLHDCVKQGLTDEKIRDRLHQEIGYQWSLSSIRRNRRKLGISKIQGKNSDVLVENRPSLSIPPPGLDDNEKADWFRDQFKKSHLYINLKKQLDKEEIATYLEEYGGLCCQFEDIVCSEFLQIDEVLKHRILVNRTLILMRELKNEIDSMKQWIKDNPISEADPEIRKSHITINNRLDFKLKELSQISSRYDNLIKEANKMLDNLNATRKNRLDELSGGKENFFNLIMILQHSEKSRNEHGKYAELTRLAAMEEGNRLREEIEFPDGTIDYVISDHKSQEKEEDNE